MKFPWELGVLVTCVFLLPFAVGAPVRLPAECDDGGGRSLSQQRQRNVGYRAYLADAVFQGLARSKSDEDGAGVYNITFEIGKVYKGSAQLRKQGTLRLQFKSPRGGTLNNDPNPCLVQANIEGINNYIVFAKRIDHINYVAHSEPVNFTKRDDKAVRRAVCKKCVKAPRAAGLNDTSVKENGRLKLVCQIKGNPLPIISWYKDGKRLHRSKTTKIVTKRKRSTLVIPCFKPEDAGVYECRATSATKREASTFANISLTRPAPRWPGKECPIQTYCLNGGTCSYYEVIGELVCQCSVGFIGDRCQYKDAGVGIGPVRKRRMCYNSDSNRIRHVGAGPYSPTAAPLVAPDQTRWLDLPAGQRHHRLLRGMWRTRLRRLS